MNLGVHVPQFKYDYETIKRVALEADKLGYHSFWLYDHFFGPLASNKSTTDPLAECWTTLAALAPLTKRIRLGQLVTCNSYRYPSVLAKMSATLDVISNGRLEFGIGAGWFEHEYTAYGYEFPSNSVRIAQLAEAIQIIRRMWTEEKTTFNGKHYTVTNAINYPKPVQKPHPPVWVGGWGEKLLLRVVAEHADGYNTGWLSLDDYKRKLGALERHCKNIGRDPKTIKKSLVSRAVVGRTKAEVEEKLAKYAAEWSSREEFLAQNLVGTPDEVLEKLRKLEALGLSLYIVAFPETREGNLEVLHFFAEQVLRKLS